MSNLEKRRLSHRLPELEIDCYRSNFDDQASLYHSTSIKVFKADALPARASVRYWRLHCFLLSWNVGHWWRSSSCTSDDEYGFYTHPSRWHYYRGQTYDFRLRKLVKLRMGNKDFQRVATLGLPSLLSAQLGAYVATRLPTYLCLYLVADQVCYSMPVDAITRT